MSADQTNNRGQFTKGRSGNPKGRPRKATSGAHAVKKALNAKVVVTEGGRKKRVTKREAMATQMVNMAASGNLQAGKLSFELEAKADNDVDVSATDTLSATDQDVIDRLLARMRRVIEQEGQDADLGF